MANMENEITEGISSKSGTEEVERERDSTSKLTGKLNDGDDDVKVTSLSSREDLIPSITDAKPDADIKETVSKVPTIVGTKSDVDFKLPTIPVLSSSSKTSKPKQNLDSTVSSKDTISEHDDKDIGNKTDKPQAQSDTERTTKNDDRTDTVDISISTSSDISSTRFRMPLPKFSKPKQPKSKPKSGANSTNEKLNSPSSVASSSQISGAKKEVASSNSSKSVSKLSPAEKRAQAAIPIPYKEPSWSGLPKRMYHLEVLKGGTILSRINLNEKPFMVFGRLESCDVMLEHPSLSRFHMVLQYRQVGDTDNDPGFYVYDLDSTHGSFLNKQKIKAKTYCRMHVGHMFKLAGSTRLYILQGPPTDEEAESELSVTELKQMREKQLIEMEKQKMEKVQENKGEKHQESEDKGISWGMDEDDAAEDEDPSEDNPFALMSQEEREELYIKDPKKTLRGFFEREGFELEYNVEEKNTLHGRQYICRIELPVDDADGQPITAETIVTGKKKEAVVACALEACRILDAQGVLRQAKHESKKRKAKNWADDDYYDSDDDTFLDRTGEIEKKRQARMKKAGVIKEEVETFASLTAKLAEVETEMKQIDADIESLKNASSDSTSDDSLEAFMSSIKSGTVLDKTKRAKLKIRKIELRKDQARLLKLINIAKPAALPKIKRQITSSSNSNTSASTKKLPMIGSLKGRLGAKKFKFVMPVAKPSTTSAVSSTTDDVEEEEEEDDDEGMDEGEEKEGSRVKFMETEDNVSAQGSSSKDETVSSSSVVEKKTDDNRIKMSKPVIKGPSRPPSRSIKGPTLPPKISIKGPTLPPTMKGPSLPQTIKGPSLPPDLDRGDQKGPSKRDYDGGEEEDEACERKKMAKKATVEADEDVADWVPPKGQTGDGRTSLNEKYGY